MTRFSSLCLTALTVTAAVLWSCPRHARADGALVTLEANGGVPLGAPQSDRFGFGGAASAAAYYRIAPFVLAGVRLRAGALSNGNAPDDVRLVDPSTGTFETLSAMLRLRPFAAGDSERGALGLFVEGGGGGAVTGSLLRAAFEGGLGYGIALGGLALAPTVRYLQVIQPSDPLSDADAHVLLFGAELSVLDVRPKPPPEPPPVANEPPPDSDADGVPDALDKCPQVAEDRDGFQDDDGCPDPDNDGDKIADPDDQCPDQAEDMDGFQDDDGCPDPDNDQDGFLDADDQCPDEAEVINGNRDFDGCPDEGLIEFHNDRIVLEERVLFDFERARVKSAARPVLRAIVKLYKQHPEWIKIRIEGHADSRGDEKFNQELSERRAEHVRDELIKLGLPADIVEWAGYGSTRPRDRREEEDAYRRNRRVEFVVVARKRGPPGSEAGSAAAGQDASGAPAAPDEGAGENDKAEPTGEADGAAATPAPAPQPPAAAPTPAAPAAPTPPASNAGAPAHDPVPAPTPPAATNAAAGGTP